MRLLRSTRRTPKLRSRSDNRRLTSETDKPAAVAAAVSDPRSTTRTNNSTSSIRSTPDFPDLTVAPEVCALPKLTVCTQHLKVPRQRISRPKSGIRIPSRGRLPIAEAGRDRQLPESRICKLQPEPGFPDMRLTFLPQRNRYFTGDGVVILLRRSIRSAPSAPRHREVWTGPEGGRHARTGISDAQVVEFGRPLNLRMHTSSTQRE